MAAAEDDAPAEQTPWPPNRVRQAPHGTKIPTDQGIQPGAYLGLCEGSLNQGLHTVGMIFHPGLHFIEFGLDHFRQMVAAFPERVARDVHDVFVHRGLGRTAGPILQDAAFLVEQGFGVQAIGVSGIRVGKPESGQDPGRREIIELPEPLDIRELSVGPLDGAPFPGMTDEGQVSRIRKHPPALGQAPVTVGIFDGVLADHGGKTPLRERQ